MFTGFDERYNIQRFAVYNYKFKPGENFQKVFRIGKKFRLTDPYLKTALDGLSIIRIDNPS